MMALAKLFEDFGQTRFDSDQPSSRASEEFEDEKLKSFEAGYGAGWEDAIAAQSDGDRRLQEAMQQSLLDMSVSKQEAFQAYVLAMRSVMEQIVDKMLPELAHQSLSGHVMSVLEQAVADNSDLPIEIRVSPDQKAEVGRAIGRYLSEGARVAADPVLSAHQALISVGPTETLIDLDSLIEEVRGAFKHFHESIEQGG